MQNKGYYAIQGHSSSPMLVSIESPYVTYSVQNSFHTGNNEHITTGGPQLPRRPEWLKYAMEVTWLMTGEYYER